MAALALYLEHVCQNNLDLAGRFMVDDNLDNRQRMEGNPRGMRAHDQRVLRLAIKGVHQRNRGKWALEKAIEGDEGT